MNQLSNDLNTLTAEIKMYQNLIKVSSFEIGKRLVHIKENKLIYGGHGNWLLYLENELNMNIKTAQEYMRIYKELHNTSFENLNLSKSILVEIAKMDKLDRHILNTDKLSEMTVKEIRELKRLLKAKEKENQILKSNNPTQLAKVKGEHARIFIADMMKTFEFLELPLPITEYRVKQYQIDIYFEGIKLGFEFDEKHHKYQEEKDIKRQKEIEDELGCTIIKLNEEVDDHLNINKVVKEVVSRIK